MRMLGAFEFRAQKWSFVCALLCLAPALRCQAVSGGLESRIRSVETGLLSPVKAAGQSPERLDLLAEMKAHHVSALSASVIHGGQIEWSRAYGTATADGVPITVDTMFQAASISKSLTATAALYLVERGKLALDTPINTELKGWTLPLGKSSLGHPVTLRSLLSHTAGTTVHGFGGYPAGSVLPSIVQILNGEKPANSPPVIVKNEPGQSIQYSGGGFVIVQQAMMDATGSSFPDLMQRTVLKPLGMAHSTFQQPLAKNRLSEAAFPYEEGKPVSGGPHIYPEMAAAGLWTTPTDLARWITALQASLKGKKNPVLTVAMTHTMLTPVRDGYGLGVEVGGTGEDLHFSHGGANAGYRAIYFADAKGDGAVVMTNSDTGDDVAAELLRSIASEYGWSRFKQIERPFVPIPFAAQLPFIGNFTSTDGYRLKISSNGKQLEAQFPNGETSPLVTSGPKNFFTTASTLQLQFDSSDSGMLVFAEDDKVAFHRTK